MIVGVDVDKLATDMTYAKENSNLVLPAFHSAFNIANTFIMIWLVPVIEKIVCKVIKPKQEAEDEESRLRFITAGLMQTPELSILNAKKEIAVFAERCYKMFGFVQELLHTTKGDDFNKLFSRIEKYESITDKMEVQIANYLNSVSEGRLSLESKTEIQHMLRMVSELESIGDACYNLARSMNRKRQHTTEDFTEKQYEHIQNMMALADDALLAMTSIVKANDQKYADLNKSYNLEHEINNYRNQLKNQNIFDINNHLYNYQMGVYYMDIIAECEKLGDYIINVIEASGLKDKGDK
jgi:phosphate:Na+ symporter